MISCIAEISSFLETLKLLKKANVTVKSDKDGMIRLVRKTVTAWNKRHNFIYEKMAIDLK